MLESQQPLSQPIDRLGYYHEVGNVERLHIALRAVPTGDHFDPERIAYPAIRGKRIEKAVYNRTTLPSIAVDQPVGVGPVTLMDRIDKHVGFFTFGGSLNVVKRNDETVCTITSEAPIFPTSLNFKDTGGEFVTETMALLGRLRAEHGMRNDEAKWEEKLSQLSPQEIYKGAIISIYNKYKKTPAFQTMYPEFYRDLQNVLFPQTRDSSSLEKLLSLS